MSHNTSVKKDPVSGAYVEVDNATEQVIVETLDFSLDSRGEL